MIRKVSYESQERREAQVLAALNAEGIKSVEEANQICDEAGVDPYLMCEETQRICFENAKWAYVCGAAIAIKRGCKTAADCAEAIGVGLQAFCIPGSVADDRKVGLGHGNLAARLLREETKCFAFLAGHESFAAAEGAIKIAEMANKVRKNPLRVILNGLGKDAAMIISRIILALHVLNDVGVPLFAETEVQEAGAGDLNRSKVGAIELHVLGEDIRDLARVLAHGLGGGQAEGGGVVAVGGILGDLDRGDGLHAIGQQTLLHGGAVGAARQGGDLVLCALDHIHSFFPRSFVVDAAARCRAAKVQNRNVYYTTAVCGKQAVFAISAAKAGAFLCRRTRNSACTDSAALI